MKSEKFKKQIVKDKYSEIARQYNGSCCNSSSSCCGVDYSIFSENYKNLDGYNSDADLGLGCGLPTEFAQIKQGDTVIDLGSGSGNDCFVARALVGETGKIIGIDFTEAMIEKARQISKKLGFNNVEFILGDIEKIPLAANIADVIISNCVLNLVPNKKKVFQEIYRILKPGGHLSVSDVVLKGELPDKLKQAAELYAGCISGAIQLEDYLKIIKESGLTNVIVQKQKLVNIPDEILSKYLNKNEIEMYKNSGTGIYSITVYAEKTKLCCCNCDC